MCLAKAASLLQIKKKGEKDHFDDKQHSERRIRRNFLLRRLPNSNITAIVYLLSLFNIYQTYSGKIQFTLKAMTTMITYE